MRYAEFRENIRRCLESTSDGMTWMELRRAADLSYRQPCPEWVKQLEVDLGLIRTRRRGRALIWELPECPGT